MLVITVGAIRTGLTTIIIITGLIITIAQIRVTTAPTILVIEAIMVVRTGTTTGLRRTTVTGAMGRIIVRVMAAAALVVV
ncbi:hypothetical protein LPJCM8341_29480 [Lactiplantibacillus plantarum subsp. plantarum]|nr:hypothetical protein LPL02_03260 [Lactiplantibacillus plantarum subsp. plantarum]GIU65763.1 hypothetical protein LPJCM8341_29480 [Lactiplantibacillus plantarum subsp. plantarum]